jgi:hypothetical protein
VGWRPLACANDGASSDPNGARANGVNDVSIHQDGRYETSVTSLRRWRSGLGGHSAHLLTSGGGGKERVAGGEGRAGTIGSDLPRKMYPHEA